MSPVNVVSLRLVFVFFTSLLLVACSSDDKDEELLELFSIQFEQTDLSLASGETLTLSYQITAQSDFSVSAELSGDFQANQISLDTGSQTLTFIAGTTASTGSFIVRFSSANHAVNQAFTYQVIASNDDGDDEDNNGSDSEDTDGGEDDCDPTQTTCPDTTTSQTNKIFLPSEYITLFEDETIEIKLKRNYEMNADITESFYFNSPHISGRLSQDKQSLIIKGLEGTTDTYGDIVAVTKTNGVEQKSVMRLVYFNKNRDLTTAEAPVIALLQQEVELTPFTSKTINFDVYDPDSDRISYRIIEAPSWLETHIHKAQAGFDLTFYPIDNIESDDNQVTLEVSDAHNTDRFTFILNEKTQSGKGLASGQTRGKAINSENRRPRLFVENNVSLSLLKRLTGTETGNIAKLAFAYQDLDGDHIDLSAISSSSTLKLQVAYPFVYVSSDDISSLQHEQITVVAADEHYESKLTFHLYNKNNFTSFLGGNPNLAPLIAIDDPIRLLETKAASVSYELADNEQHDFDAEIGFNKSYIHAFLNDSKIEITALPIEGEDDIETEITITATDVFGSSRQQTIQVTVEKNTPPEISFSQNGAPYDNIHLVEGANISFNVLVNDINEGEITPQFDYDTSKLHLDYDDGLVTLIARDIVEDFDGEFKVYAIDEFDARTDASLPLHISFTNSEPVITASQTEVNLFPGDSIELDLTYVDPEADEMSINRVVDNSNLSFTYDEDTKKLTLTVDAAANYEDVYHFTTTASDGFLDSQLIIRVNVPDEPVPPVISVEPYFTNVNEGATFFINFEVTDDNGDDVNVSLSGGSSDLQLTLLDSDDADDTDDHVQVVVPDNVLVDTNYSFNINAVDNSPSLFTDIETINFTVLPVNDVPQVTLSQDTITMINDDQFSLPITIVDPDDTTHTIEVRSLNSALVPSDIVIHATSNNAIILSGAAKGTVVNNLPLVIRVYDSEAFTDATLTVNVELDNRAPNFDERVDLIQMPENSTQTFNITPTDPDAATDGDVVSIVSVTVDDPTAVTIVGDPNNPPLNTVTIQTQEVTELTTVFVSIVATDGYVNVTKLVQVDITDSN